MSFPFKNPFEFEALEPRILLSADAAAAGLPASSPDQKLPSGMAGEATAELASTAEAASRAWMEFEETGLFEGMVVEEIVSPERSNASTDGKAAELSSEQVAVGALSAGLIYVDPAIGSSSCLNYDPTTRSCTGGTATAYPTLAGANAAVTSGQTVLIRGGSYNERIAPAQSGTEFQMIKYQRYAEEQVLLTLAPAISLTGRSYIAVDGMTVRTSSCGTAGCYVLLDNSHHVTVENSIMDQVGAQSSWPTGVAVRNNSHHNVFRGNVIGNVGYASNDDIGGVVTVGSVSDPTGDASDYNLFEDNVLFHGGHHVVEVYAKNNIFKGNLLYNENWMDCRRTETGNKCGNRLVIVDGPPNAATGNIFDSNRFSQSGAPPDDNTAAQFGLRAGKNIVRNNAFYYGDSAGLAIESYTYWGTGHDVALNRIYQNTFYHSGYSSSRFADHCMLYGMVVADQGGGMIRNLVIKNNLFHDNKNGAINFYYNAPRESQVMANNWEHAGDPKFVNPAFTAPSDATSPNLGLSAGSGAIDQGAFLTQTTGAGSGFTIPVADAGFFTDGYGLVPGDLIQLAGQAEAARVTAVNYSANTVTVDKELTWAAGIGVSLRYMGSAPDIGAYEFSASTDVTPPVITGLNHGDVSSSGATIGWLTDEPSDSQVEYGLTTDLGQITALNPALVSQHNVSLTGLAANTLYYYRARSKDAAGNVTVSSIQSFTTGPEVPPVDTTAPVISNIRVSNITATTATITWLTDEPSTSKVTYGGLTAFHSDLVTSHSITLTGLKKNTQYSYTVSSTDASGNTTVSKVLKFKTSAR